MHILTIIIGVLGLIVALATPELRIFLGLDEPPAEVLEEHEHVEVQKSFQQENRIDVHNASVDINTVFQRKKWNEERKKLEQRISSFQEAEIYCDEKWSLHEECYWKGRMLSKETYQQEYHELTQALNREEEY